MKRRTAFIFLLSLTCYLGFAQTQEAVDELHRQLANARDDTSRINAEVALCRLYRLGNTDSSLIYGQRALESATRIKYLKGQIQALSSMCIVVKQQGNLAKSLELGFKALQIAEDNHMEGLAGPALDGIGETYIVLKDYPKALSYLRRDIPPSQFSLSGEGVPYAYFDIGVAFEGMDQLDSAEYYERKATETFQKYGYEEPLVYQALGDIKMKSRKVEQALAYYQKSLQVAIGKNESRASAYAYNKLAAFYKGLNEPDSAIFYSQKCLEESRTIAQKKTIFEAATLLSELYEVRDTKESLRYLRIADAYKDSLFGAGSIEAVQVLVRQQEEHQKQIQDARIKFQNQLKEYALIAGVAILFIIAFILYRNNRQKQKAKIKIEKAYEDLKATQQQLVQSEKMASLGELTAGIAHEIQNPLNFVNNFSDVNKELLVELKDEIKKGNMDEVIAIANNVIDNEGKISHHGRRADAIVKGMLQHSRTSSGQKELTDINALADEYLRLAYHGIRAKDKSFNAKFETDFDNVIGKVNVVPQDIGRVLLNLINNAFYAVTEKIKQNSTGYEPTVIVSTQTIKPPLGGLGVSISVKDNGNGIPQSTLDKIFQPFFTTKPTGQGTGLGLSLSYDIIKAHGGEIKVETKVGEGSEFIIQLPVNYVIA